MDVNAFYTRSAAGSPAPSPTGAAALGKSGAQTGVLGFLDLLLSTLGTKDPAIGNKMPSPAGEQDLAQKESDKNADSSAVENLLQALEDTLGASDLAHLRAALSTATGQEKTDLLSLLRGLVEDKAETDANLAAGLLALLNGTDISPSNPTGEALSTPKNLETNGNGQDEAARLAGLLTANLTPEQIANLAQRAAKLKEGLERSNGIAFLTALLSQDQSANKQAAGETLPQTSDPGLLPQKPAIQLTSPAGDGQQTADGQAGAALTLAQTIARIVEENRASTKGRREARFADLLLEGSTEAAGSGKAASPGTGLSPALLSALKSLPAQTKGAANLLLSSPLETGALSGLPTTLDPDAALAQWLERLTSPMTASATTAAVSANNTAAVSPLTGAHPASQIVAAALLRAAQGGETRTLTLNLNPPELGRVEVRMEMARDRSVKTVLSVEKPETLTLLQRDAHMLERALQNAGFDSGGDFLRFELAQDGGAFDPREGGSGHGRGSSGSGSDEPDSESLLIETKMSWFIDPHTGAQRYDLYV